MESAQARSGASLRELRRSSAIRLATEAKTDAERHHIHTLTSDVAFRLVFSLFPGLLALLWALHSAHAGGLVNDLLSLISTVMPSAAQKPLRDQLVDAPGVHSHGTLAWTALLSLVIAIGSVASAFRAMAHALNVLSDTEETRSRRKLFAVSFLAAVTVGLLVVAAIMAAVSGRHLAEDATGGNIASSTAWAVASWTGLAVVVWLATTLTYRFAPAAPGDFRWSSLGSLLATVAWVVYTALFALYVNLFSKPEQTYGALAGVAITMLYVYATAFIVLFGYQLDRIAAAHTERHAGVSAP